ncbi:unnamed protein product [Cyprideis torosa]|uniref:Uncharacterized protein n=1 Tax=Cyprideis torosa TaxID=163714 RepID=A0A7R8WJR8_9CRUS|nr:unnamed protein product [Cyprideis torosa]CAG0902314.1 unnamed protein product [Cyprideis torosa]
MSQTHYNHQSDRAGQAADSSSHWIQDIPYPTKTMLPIALVVLTMAAILISSVSSQDRILDGLHRFSSVHLPAVDYLLQADRDLYQALVAERTLLMSDSGSPHFDDLLKDHDSNIQQAHDRLKKYTEVGMSGASDPTIQQLFANLATWKSVSNEVIGIIRSNTPDARKKAAVLSMGRSDETFQAVRDIIDQLGERQFTQSSTESAQQVSDTRDSKIWLTVAGTIGILLSSGILLMLALNTSHRLKKIATRMNDIAGGEGDLTERLDFVSKDELGQIALAFNRFSGKIQSIVQSASDASTTVTAATKEMATGNNDLAIRTESQAAGLQKTATAMDEITSSVQQNADNAKRASDVAKNAKLTAASGGEQVNEVIKAMHAIAESSRKISDIVVVVDEIAFQTNLLALNAAVEAARAGDQGVGFAVVAAEVRILAQRSGESASQIKKLINESLEKINAGSQLADRSGEALHELVASVQEVADLITEISETTFEQSSGIKEINAAINQIEGITQRNAGLVQEAAVSTQELERQAEELNQILRTIKLDKTSYPSRNTSPHQNRGYYDHTT